MIIVGLTESSARFITGLIVFMIVGAFFGWLSQVTGVHPFIIVGIVLLAFMGLVAALFVSARPKKQIIVSDDQRCTYIRANDTQCVRAIIPSTSLCEHHTKFIEKYGVRTEDMVKPAREKRSQCGFIKDDGSKCKKLKPISIKRCSYHLKIEGATAG
jgi:hypothetical protein